MTAIPEPLKPEDCPLLQKFSDRLAPVLAEFSQAVEMARKLAARYPERFKQEDVQATLGRLAEARKDLTTPRFKVGFLGPFQCGKSTILNNLVGQPVSGVGVGKACTSVVTRLIVDPAGRSQELKLQYFTEDQYQDRRNTLCEWVRLKNPAGRSESQLLELLKTHNPNSGLASSAHRPIRRKDLPYLRAFLQSYEDNKPKKLVRAEAYVETVPFAARDRLLTHQSKAEDDEQIQASQYLLVAESSITFPTDRVDPELELVDCPGLGSGRSVDDLLTTEYIRELHGALVFLRADAMDNADVSEILRHLNDRFKSNLHSRVWVVVNKMDIPDRHAKMIGHQGQTTFDAIVDLVRNKIPLSQVCLACNDIFQLAATAGDGKAERGQALALIKLGAQDEPVIREQLKRNPDLLPMFDEMLKDGSVSLLRRLIKEKIRPSVAQEILADAEKITRQAVPDLRYVLEQEEKPASEQEQQDALAWENALYVLLSELSGGRPRGRGALFIKLEELGKAARTSLQKEFVARVPEEVLSEMNVEALLGRFGIDANRMQKEVDKEFERMVQALYTEVTSNLEGRGLAPVTLAGGRDPMTLWLEFRQQDRDEKEWRQRLRPRLHDQGFLDRLGSRDLAQTFDGEKYKKLLLDKLRTASHQIALAVRGRLRHRLDSLRRQVSRKLGSAAQPAAARKE